MATKNKLKWQEKYEQLKAYIAEHKHLPGKRNVENRALLNWWKYNRKRINHGQIDPERERLLTELSNMRDL